MPAKPLPRPRQVSFSGWSIVVGSVLTILFAFQRIAELGSLEAQEAALQFVSTAPGDGLGLSVDEVQTAIRVMCLVAGGAAAATAILGWQVMQPSRSARVALSILAPLVLVAGLASGGIFPALVAAATAMLWVQPARDYLDGTSTTRDQAAVSAMSGGSGGSPSGAPGASGTSAASDAPPPPPASVGSSWDLPRPAAASDSRATMTDMSQLPPNPYGAPTPPAHTDPQRRPGRVTAAAITTIVASGLTLAGLLVSLLFILSSRDDFVSEINDELAGNSAYDGVSPDTAANVAVGFLVVLAVWCVVAIVLAAVMMRGSNGARIALIVSASLSALVSLLGALVIVPLALTIASIVTVVLLLTGGAGDWFAARKRLS